MSEQADPKKNATMSVMILLHVINFGLVCFWSFDGAAMPLFLTAKFGLSNAAIGWILGIGKLIIALSLFMGLFSDLIWTRMGKRRPLMLIGGLISAPLIALIPHVPSVWLLVITLTVIYFGIQFAAVPYFALVPEIVPNEKLGTTNAFFSLFGSIGTLVAYLVLLMLIYKTNKPLAFLVLGVMHLVGTLVSVFTTRERIADEPPARVGKLKGMALGTVDIIRELPRLPDLLVFMAANLLWWLGLGAFLLFFTKYYEYYVNYPGPDAGMILGLVIGVAVFLAVPIGILGDKLSRKWMTFAGMCTVAVGLTVGYFTIGPLSRVSGYDISSSAGVEAVAAAVDYELVGADMAGFADVEFEPRRDVNNDGVFNRKSDVMRFCLNGTLAYELDGKSAADEPTCEAEIANIMGPGDPALDRTIQAFHGLSKLIKAETASVVVISFVVITFAAIGLTICFIVMATILPTLMPEARMGVYMGFYSTCTGIGQFLSVVVAGFIIDATLHIPALGYRWMFIQGIVFVALGAVAVALTPYIPNAKDPTITELARRREQDGRDGP